MSSPQEEEHGSFLFSKDYARHYRPVVRAERELLNREIEEHVTAAHVADEEYKNTLNEQILLATQDMNADMPEITFSSEKNTPTPFALPNEAIILCEALFDDYLRALNHLLETQKSVNVSCGWEGDAQMVQAILDKGRDLTEMRTMEVLVNKHGESSEEMDRPLCEEDERVAGILQLEVGSIDRAGGKTLHKTLKDAEKGIARISKHLD